MKMKRREAINSQAGENADQATDTRNINFRTGAVKSYGRNVCSSYFFISPQHRVYIQPPAFILLRRVRSRLCGAQRGFALSHKVALSS